MLSLPQSLLIVVYCHRHSGGDGDDCYDGDDDDEDDDEDNDEAEDDMVMIFLYNDQTTAALHRIPLALLLQTNLYVEYRIATYLATGK